MMTNAPLAALLFVGIWFISSITIFAEPNLRKLIGPLGYVFGALFFGVCGSFASLVFRTFGGERYRESLSPKVRRAVKLLVVPALIGSVSMFAGGALIASSPELAESAQMPPLAITSLLLCVGGTLTAAIPALIGGVLGFVVDTSKFAGRRRTTRSS